MGNSVRYFYNQIKITKYQTVSVCIIICFILSVCSDLSCDLARQCIGQSLTDPGTYEITGYKAAFGPSTSWSGGGIRCWGSFSCHSMSFITANLSHIFCAGTDACSNSTIQSNSQIQCHGSGSCGGSTMTATNQLTCEGYKSCANSYIHGVTILQATAQFSLFNATIDSNITSITMILSGSLAGYGAKLLCGEGHTCNILCHGLDSCFMFYIECLGTCNVVKSSASAIAPTTNISLLNYDMSSHKLFESESTKTSHQESCTIDSWTFDNARERYYGPDITITADNESSLCCRGYSACSQINIEFQTKAKQDLICSGRSSCTGSTITSNNNSIFCESVYGCKFSSIINAANVYCSGGYSCEKSILSTASFILCRGIWSCSSAAVVSNGTDLNIYFTGYFSGPSLTLHCNETDLCNIYCIGYQSCTGTTLFCIGNCNVECANSTCPVLYDPSKAPTLNPSQSTQQPIQYPSIHPSQIPSMQPTVPTQPPTQYPSLNPAVQSTMASIPPTQYPSFNPSQIPSTQPTEYPSLNPTQIPTQHPSSNPSQIPSMQPAIPTKPPTQYPSLNPSMPSTIPSMPPTRYPSFNPSQIPSMQPAIPSVNPTRQPTQYPSFNPTQQPTEYPSSNPTQIPTQYPSFNPTQYPSWNPTQIPSMQPTIPPSLISFINSTLYSNQSPSTHTVFQTLSNLSDTAMITVWSVIGCIVIVIVIILYFKKQKQTTEENQKMMAMNKNEGENNHELIRIWLTSTVGLEQYFELFIKSGYDSLEFISKISDKNELVEIGIKMPGHRTQIMAEIESLKQQQNQSHQAMIKVEDKNSKDSVQSNVAKEGLGQPGHQGAIHIASEHSSGDSSDDLWEPQLPIQSEGIEMTQNTIATKEQPETTDGLFDA